MGVMGVQEYKMLDEIIRNVLKLIHRITMCVGFQTSRKKHDNRIFYAIYQITRGQFVDIDEIW